MRVNNTYSTLLTKKDGRKRISKQVSNILSTPDNPITIEFSKNIPVHPSFTSIAERYRDLCLKVFNHNSSAEAMSTVLFKLGGPRNRKTKKPLDSSKSRAWFVVSQAPLTVDSIRLPYKSGIQYIFGGPCRQIMKHYHYLFITNHNFSQADIQSVNSQFLKVEKVVTSVRQCLIYISQQLISDPIEAGVFENMKGGKIYPSKKVPKPENTKFRILSINKARELYLEEDIYNCPDIDNIIGYNGQPVFFVSQLFPLEYIIEKIYEALGPTPPVWCIAFSMRLE